MRGPRRSRAPLWACLLLLLRAAAQSDVPLLANGSDGCPCANQSEYRPHNVSGLPQSYGIGCRAHDSGLPACAGGSPPSWCSQAWCFVKRGCSLRLSAAKQDLFPGRALSYATCGYLSDAATSLLGAALRGRAIRVVLMHQVGGWQGAYYVDGKTVGPTFTFWTRVFESAGVTADVVTQFASGSLPFVGNGFPYPLQVMRPFRQDNPGSNSSFTSCVYMTGMGFADVCVGPFTISLARRQVSTMLTVRQLQVFLVALSSPAPPDLGFWDYVLAAFQVFDYQLWIVIGCVTLAMSLLLAWHEHFDFGAERLGELDGLPLIERIELSLYSGFAALTGGRCLEPANRASRVISLGLHAFVVLVCAAYTAHLTCGLVLRGGQPAGTPIGLDDAVQRGYRICCPEAMVPILTSNFGVPTSSVVAVLLNPGLVSGLLDGSCDVSLVDEELWAEAMSDGGDRCRLTKLGGGALFTVDDGAPVSDDVARTLDVHVTKLTALGVWKALRDAALPTDLCAGNRTSTAAVTTLSLKEFLGPILLTGLFVVLAFVLQLCDCMHAAAAKKVKKPKFGRAPTGALSRTSLVENPSKGEADGLDEALAIGPSHVQVSLAEAKVAALDEAQVAAVGASGVAWEAARVAAAPPLTQTDLQRVELEATVQRLLGAIHADAQAREREAEGRALLLKLLEQRGTAASGAADAPASTIAAVPAQPSGELRKDGEKEQDAMAGAESSPRSATNGPGDKASPRFMPRLRGRAPPSPRRQQMGVPPLWSATTL